MQNKSLFPNFLIYVFSAPTGARFNFMPKKRDTKNQQLCAFITAEMKA